MAEDRKGKIVVGITGQIATGKSTVCSIFGKLGAFCISADSIAKEILNNKETQKAVKERLPNAFNGEILCTKALKETVFLSSANREALNSIMHPKIVNRIIKEIEKSDKSFIVVEVPLLFELSLEGLFNYIICTVCSTSEQLKRIQNRDGVDISFAKKMIGSQLSQEEKMKSASVVIDTEKDISEIEKEVKKIMLALTRVFP